MSIAPSPIESIDWALLREQKQWLVDQDLSTDAGEPHAEGLVYLLGAIQDYAVEVLGLEEQEVFNFSEDDDDE